VGEIISTPLFIKDIIMSWTYSGDPSKSNKDAVRFLVGDTDQLDQLSTDEEIDWALLLKTNIYNAASLIASGIATNLARLKISVKIGPISEEYGDRAKFYAARAKELNDMASSNMAILVYGGGIIDVSSNPAFTVGMHDYIADTISTDETTNE
jgi:hypothetical protein